MPFSIVHTRRSALLEWLVHVGGRWSLWVVDSPTTQHFPWPLLHSLAGSSVPARENLSSSAVGKFPLLCLFYQHWRFVLLVLSDSQLVSQIWQMDPIYKQISNGSLINFWSLVQYCKQKQISLPRLEPRQAKMPLTGNRDISPSCATEPFRRDARADSGAGSAWQLQPHLSSPLPSGPFPPRPSPCWEEELLAATPKANVLFHVNFIVILLVLPLHTHLI